MATCCQTHMKVCSPAFLLIEDIFYDIDGDSALSKQTEALFNQKEMTKKSQMHSQLSDSKGLITIPSQQNQIRMFGTKFGHENAYEKRLGDVSFRIGYPYLMRHSTAEEDYGD